jgi:hypothetical protein
MNKTLLLRKFENSFIETIVAEGKPVAKRSFDSWDKLAKRLSHSGLLSEEIAHIKLDFESGKDTLSFLIP